MDGGEQTRHSVCLFLAFYCSFRPSPDYGSLADGNDQFRPVGGVGCAVDSHLSLDSYPSMEIYRCITQ